MEYAVGKTGRIIAARLFEGEDLFDSVHQIAATEKINSAAVFIRSAIEQIMTAYSENQ